MWKKLYKMDTTGINLKTTYKISTFNNLQKSKVITLRSSYDKEVGQFRESYFVSQWDVDFFSFTFIPSFFLILNSLVLVNITPIHFYILCKFRNFSTIIESIKLWTFYGNAPHMFPSNFHQNKKVTKVQYLSLRTTETMLSKKQKTKTAI